MAAIRTDDGPRRLRSVWLGPKGATLPFEWTYVQWVVTIACAMVGMVVFTLIWWLLSHDALIATVSGIAWGIAAGTYAAVRLMRGVDADEPIGYKLGRIRQLGHRDQDQVPDTTAVDFPAVRIRPMGSGSAHCLRWSEQLDPTTRTPGGVGDE